MKSLSKAPMLPEAEHIWSGLEFRLPMLLRNVEPLDEQQLHWSPPGAGHSIAWQLWHIAEVEDNWPRSIVYEEPPRLPFGVQMREAVREQYPEKTMLLDYLREVRSITRTRLESVIGDYLERVVVDPDFGECTVRDIWAGVVTSFAWHAGQVGMTAKMLPGSPVKTLHFNYWRGESSSR